MIKFIIILFNLKLIIAILIQVKIIFITVNYCGNNINKNISGMAIINYSYDKI